MKVGHEINVAGPATRAEDGAHDAVRLSYASMAERTVCDGCAAVLQPLIDGQSAFGACKNRVPIDV